MQQFNESTYEHKESEKKKKKKRTRHIHITLCSVSQCVLSHGYFFHFLSRLLSCLHSLSSSFHSSMLDSLAAADLYTPEGERTISMKRKWETTQKKTLCPNGKDTESCMPSCVYVSLVHAKTDMLYCLSAKKVVMTAATKSNPSRTTKEEKKATHKTFTNEILCHTLCVCVVLKTRRIHRHT